MGVHLYFTDISLHSHWEKVSIQNTRCREMKNAQNVKTPEEVTYFFVISSSQD